MGFGGGRSLSVAVNGQGSQVIARRASIAADEMDYVQDRRRRFRASWQDCAIMVGRAVHDVRLACDPPYAQAFSTVPAAPVRIGKPSLRPDCIEARVLMGLGAVADGLHEAGPERASRFANARRRTRAGPVIAEIVAMTGLSVDRTSYVLGCVNRLGFVDRNRDVKGSPEWILTDKGIEELTRLRHARDKAAANG